VVCGKAFRGGSVPCSYNDDRVVENVVGQVTADLGDLLDPADLLPHLAPQPVSFCAGVLLRDVGVDTDGHRRREVFGDLSRRIVWIGVDLDCGVEIGFGVGH
jgi:hypothetical protein